MPSEDRAGLLGGLHGWKSSDDYEPRARVGLEDDDDAVNGALHHRKVSLEDATDDDNIHLEVTALVHDVDMSEIADLTAPEPPQPASLTASTFNLSNTILGSGIIGLPYALYEAGFVLGIVLLLLVGVLSDYSLRLLIRAGSKVNRFDYEEVMSFCFGRRGYAAGLIFIFLLDFGSMVSYVVTVGDIITPVFSYYVGDDHVLASRAILTTLVCVIFMAPLSLLRSMRSLGFVSTLSVGCIGSILLIVAVRGLPHAGNEQNGVSNAEQAVSTVVGSHIFSAFATMAFAFECQDVSFQVFQSLRAPTQKRWAHLVHSALSITVLICVAFAVIGYVSFGDRVEDNIFKNFTDDSDHIVNAARLVLAATLVMTYPIGVFMCRHVIARLAGFASAGQFSLSVHVGVTIGLFVTSIGIGASVRSLGLVQAMTGSISAVALAFIMPGMIALRVEQLVEKRPLCSRLNAGPLLLIVFGVISALIATVQTITTYS